MASQPDSRTGSGSTARTADETGALSGARVRVVQIADRPREEPLEHSPSAPPGAASSVLMWCLPLFFLGAIVLGVVVVLVAPQGLFGWSFGLLVAAGLGWVIVSTFFPGKADRVCPECSQRALRRLDPRTTTGLLCGQCGWQDDSASSFFLAESEGPLEGIVLAQRGRQTATEE